MNEKTDVHIFVWRATPAIQCARRFFSFIPQGNDKIDNPFLNERNFMTSLSDVKQAEIIEAFKSTTRYLDDLLNIDNPYFEGMVNRICPSELQLNKANTSDTEAPFLDLHLSISNGFVSSKIYDKRDDFDFDTVNFPFYLLRGLHLSTYSVC